jgi:Spy/CpxP family protein refolding chaperone
MNQPCQPWKLVLLLSGIFVTGAVAGGVVAMRYVRHAMPRHASPEQWGPARLKRLSEQLNLTPDQEEKLRPIVRRDMEDLGRIRASSFTESKRIFERMEHDIAEVLTPEQREKFEQMNRERREHLQRLMMMKEPFGEREIGHHGHDGPNAHDEPPPGKPPGGI